MMSELAKPLMSKPPESESPGDQTQERKAVFCDGQHFDEARFLSVLKELKDPSIPVTVKDLYSEVKCSCSCRLGMIVGQKDGAVYLVGLDSETRMLGQHQAEVSAVSAAGGIAVSGSFDRTVRIWDIEKNEELAILDGHREWVRCVAISADGKYIVSGSNDKTVRIWDADERKQLAVLKEHTGYVFSVSISSDGRHFVSGSQDNTVRIWDLDERKQLAVLEGHSGSVNYVLISPDGKYIVSGSADKTLRIWDLQERKQLTVLEGHQNSIGCLSISLDGKIIVSGSRDYTLRIWDLQERKQVAVLEGHTFDVNCVSIWSDGKRIVSGSSDKTVRIWDVDDQKQLAVLGGHTSYINCVSISADGKHILSGSSDRTVRIWDSEDRKQIEVLEGHTSHINCVAISCDGKHLISGSNDKTLRIWDFEDRKQLALLQGHSSYVNCVSISSDGRYIVSGSGDKTLRIWDLEGQKELAVLKGHTDWVSCVAISADGIVASGSHDKTVRIWDLEGSQIAVLEGHTCALTCVSISSNGIVVSGSYDKTLRIWSLEGRKELAVLEGHTSFIYSVSISLDGKHVVSGSKDKTVRVWDVEARKELGVLEGHTDWVRCVSISTDGKYIASGSMDKTVRIWDLEERKQLVVFEGHTSEVYCVSISNDGKYVVSGSHDKTIRIIDLVTIHPLRFSLLSDMFRSGELHLSLPCYFYGGYQDDLMQGTLIARSLATSPILPHYFNSLHICACYNKFEALKYYLEQGVPLIRGVFGSPLTIAIEKNTTKCIDVVLKYLISAIEEKASLQAIQEIADDFPKLLLCKVPSLVDFFGKLLGKSTQSLPEFIVPLRELPHIRFQGPFLIHLPDFAQFNGPVLLTQNGDLVEFWISRFDWNFELGSASSLAFLRALEDCTYSRILTVPLVMSLVQSKWEKLLPITRIHTLLYVLLLLCLVGLTFNYWRPETLNIGFMCLNVLFLLYEIVQSFANGTDYWVDPWNYVDLIRGLASVVWGYFLFREVELQYLHFLVVCVCFFRGFTFFRTFKMTRVFVRIVIGVVREMYAFLVVLAYSTCSFGLMYAVLLPDQISGAPDAWTTAYLLLMGTHDETDFDLLKWLCFSAASLVNVIIMLNLLISILGDAYEKAQMSASESDNLEMLKLIIEYESMFFWIFQRMEVGRSD